MRRTQGVSWTAFKLSLVGQPPGPDCASPFLQGWGFLPSSLREMPPFFHRRTYQLSHHSRGPSGLAPNLQTFVAMVGSGQSPGIKPAGDKARLHSLYPIPFLLLLTSRRLSPSPLYPVPTLPYPVSLPAEPATCLTLSTLHLFLGSDRGRTGKQPWPPSWRNWPERSILWGAVSLILFF